MGVCKERLWLGAGFSSFTVHPRNGNDKTNPSLCRVLKHMQKYLRTSSNTFLQRFHCVFLVQTLGPAPEMMYDWWAIWSLFEHQMGVHRIGPLTQSSVSIWRDWNGWTPENIVAKWFRSLVSRHSANPKDIDSSHLPVVQRSLQLFLWNLRPFP